MMPSMKYEPTIPAERMQGSSLHLYARAGLLEDVADATRFVVRVRFIEQARSLGLTLAEIRALLRCASSSRRVPPTWSRQHP
jgi:DNA-binding transcriptional MerR regulator